MSLALSDSPISTLEQQIPTLREDFALYTRRSNIDAERIVSLFLTSFFARLGDSTKHTRSHSKRCGIDLDGVNKREGGLLSIINHLQSTLEAPHCGERSTAV
jgi:hypothetical protein